MSWYCRMVGAERLCRQMCGKALPFRPLLISFFWRLIRGPASNQSPKEKLSQLTGKAKPYRTSGGGAISSNFRNRLNQSLNLVIIRVARTTDAHQAFRLKA